MAGRMRGGAGSGFVGLTLMAGAVTASILGWGRGESPEEIERQNARAHECSDSDCYICECNRRWLRDNPGRSLGDLLEASESASWVVVDPDLPPMPVTDRVVVLRDRGGEGPEWVVIPLEEPEPVDGGPRGDTPDPRMTGPLPGVAPAATLRARSGE